VHISYRIIDRRLEQTDPGSGSIWVYTNPDDKEKRFLIDEMKLDEHTLNSALDPDELSRLEFEPEHMATIFKRPKNYSGEDKFLFKSASSGAFLFKDKLILVMAEDIPLFEGVQFARVFSPAHLLLKLIYSSIFHFIEHLKIISAISDDLQTKINTAMENRHLYNLFALEKSLVYYLNSINSNGALIDKLRLNAAKIGFTNEEIELLDDIYIENSQCYKQAEIYSNILAGLMDARASIVSNNLNVLMKNLNLITILIMVPTLVVSAFSMNVKIPIQDHPFAFWIILGLAFLSVLGFIMIWRNRKW
jgi:magnesium transporter